MSDGTRMTDEEFRATAIARLLGEFDVAEEHAFERELARRGPSGLAELRSLQTVLGEIALAPPPHDPPALLRERVLAGAARGPALSTRSFAWPWAAAAVMAALAVGLGAWAARLDGERDRLQTELRQLDARLATQLAGADSARDSLAALREVVDLVGAPGSAVLGLAGTGSIPEASARVFVDPETGRALLFAYELPVLAPDLLYELWAIGEEGPRAVGVFRPDESGRARLDIRDPQVLRDAGTLAVTIEPAPGVDQPTGEIVLSGRT